MSFESIFLTLFLTGYIKQKVKVMSDDKTVPETPVFDSDGSPDKVVIESALKTIAAMMKVQDSFSESVALCGYVQVRLIHYLIALDPEEKVDD